MAVLPESARAVVQPLARQAFVGGFGTVLWVAGLLALFGALVVGTLMRNPLPGAQPFSLAGE
ncbi:MFS transporter, partial [Pseudomonas gingeri]|nr:MFS transporter [Pseudomonas gingeri]